MVAQIGDGAVQFALFEESGFADQPFACTKPAIDRALVRHHQQDAIRVAMHQMRHRTHQVFFERVVLRIEVVNLGEIGYHLFPDGIALRFDRGQHRRGNPHGILPHDASISFGSTPSRSARSFGFTTL